MGAKVTKDRILKEDLEFLVLNTHYSEDTINAWYKGFKKDCPDGKLNPNSFIKIYSRNFTEGNLTEFCDHVFRTFDSDRNGFIDFKEFLIAMDVTSSGTPEDKLSLFFSMFDVDGNGWIDLIEMTNLMKCIHNIADSSKRKVKLIDIHKEQAKEIFEKMDIDSDGKVTKDEFIQACLVDQKLIELLTPPSADCNIQ